MTLPAGIGYTTINGRYISAVLDSTDPDREPDVVPKEGLTITLTPNLSTPILKSLTDPPVSILLTPIIAKTDANGDIVGPDGQPGIVIVASDFPDPNNPWTYSVSVQGNGFPRLTSTLIAHTGESIDLTTALEVSVNTVDLSAWSALALQVSADADRAEAAAAQSGAVTSVAGRTGVVTLASPDLTDSTVIGRDLIQATDAVAARNVIGAGTSSLALGTTVGTAKAGDYRPAVADISDATAVGKSVLTAADATAARASIGAGTSSLVLGTAPGTAMAGNTALLQLGTTASTAKAGNYQPTAANISDATTVGKAVVTAADAAAARAAVGAGTSNLALGTTAGTAADAAATQAKFDGALQVLVWDAVNHVWPAARASAVARFFISTNDATATAPTGLTQADQWFRNKDAV